MEITQFIRPSHALLLLLLLVTSFFIVNGDDKKKTYIVYMGNDFFEDEDDTDDSRFKHAAIADSHAAVLSNVIASDNAKDHIVHSYKHFNAFAAKLSPEEAEKMESRDDVVSVFENRYHKLHTTNSWDFLGFPQSVKRNLGHESNIIVGVFDTGITPGAESFSDVGFGPPPARWKGTCGPFANFSGCNNKIIGAKYFNLENTPEPLDVLSPVDINGHGTHTASTVAGNAVENADLFGFGHGTARGGVPSARIAVYKVCWQSMGCSDMDLLAAFGAAIKDGVDVISISIGGVAGKYGKDAISLGSFHAMMSGIITVASAGNSGPSSLTVENHAPWILTVAASGTPRQFRSKIMLGNGQEFSGIGIDTFNTTQSVPLIDGADAAKSKAPEVQAAARFCAFDTLDPVKVKGKIVKCVFQESGVESVVTGAGGIGAILESEFFLDAAQIYVTPTTMVDTNISLNIDSYIKSTSTPSASIYRTEEVKVPAPFIASFSSRGPNTGSVKILKPDIAAPGVNILAAYTPLKSLTSLPGDTRFSKFTFMSGTSMACPHVSGVAALVKSFHPTWSPAAIKSAIITTATPMDPKVNNEAEFAYGAGQVNPTGALKPGLVYDMDKTSYIQFLCHEGYDDASLQTIVGSKTVKCSQFAHGRGTDSLNYPTIQLSLTPGGKLNGVFRRKVTNVGSRLSVYNATINAPPGVEITVKPMSLSFTHVMQRKSFTVEVRANAVQTNPLPLSGSLVWTSSNGRTVRSPIVVYMSDGSENSAAPSDGSENSVAPSDSSKKFSMQ